MCLLCRQETTDKFREFGKLERLLQRRIGTKFLDETEDVKLSSVQPAEATGNRYDRDIRIAQPHLSNGLQTFLLGHDDVTHNGVGRRLAERAPAGLAIQCKIDVVTCLLERTTHELDEQGVVINDENVGRGGAP